MESAPGARLWDLPHSERVTVVRDEIHRVAGQLDDLDVELLDHPAIGDWTIREVVAHLVIVARFYTDNIGRGSSGDATGSGGRPAPGTSRGALAAAGIRETAADVAAAYDDQVIDKFRSAASVLADTLDADESSLEFECYHPGGIIPASRFAVLFLKELGLHEWDMFEALQPPWKMGRWGTDAALQAMEEELASGSLRWVTDPEASPDTLTLRVITSGDVTVERDLVVEPHQTRLLPVDEQRKVDSRLRIDVADFVLGCSGRRDLAAVVTEGLADGDPDALRLLGRRLTGM
jgi:hypothetical protein